MTGVQTCALPISLLSQEYAVDKNATIISGTASFSNRGGSMFENGDGKNATLITFAPTVNHFIFKNLFIGGGLEISSDSQSDYHSSAIGIGPQIGYAFGNAHGSVFPYIDLGIRYYNMKQDFSRTLVDIKLFGWQKIFGFGVIVPLKKHIGLTFEGGYQIRSEERRVG